VSSEVPFAIIPRENSIFGAVAETFDLLRLPSVGESVFVRGQVQLAVDHCLLVRSGTKIEDITRVVSHEQVTSSPQRPSQRCLISPGSGPML
jgi:prephenate dehydratase